MAEKSIVDSGYSVSDDASQESSFIDMHGSDNSTPLSPQWLQTKLGDNKMGKVNRLSTHHGEHISSLKGLGIGEGSHEVGHRKDVYKLALHDSEIGCQDRWRDDEREKNSSVRRDQRGECWLDNSLRHSAERPNSSERWSESGNRESSFDQRRETKWNTRWGPVGKVSEFGLGRNADKMGEASPRPWRSNSSMARGKAESSSQQSFTPYKQIHSGCGRGKGERSSPLSPSGHGSFNSSNANCVTSRPPHLGTFSVKSGLQTGSSHLKYSRMKLLDIYKMIDIRSQRVFVDGVIDVPSLTRSEMLEPLALSAPTIEESLIMTAIEKGEVASSDVAQVFKEGTAGNGIESVTLKQMKLGTHEGLHCIGGDYKPGGSGRHPNIEPVKQVLETYSQKAESMSEEMSISDSSFSGSAAQWKSQSDGFSCLPSTELNDYHAGFGVQPSGFNWSHSSEDAENEATSSSVSSSFCKNDWLKNHSGDVENEGNSKIRRHASEISDGERTANPAVRNFEPLPSPEELSLYYKDPHGQVQGPFSGSDLIGWFEAGYFGIDLEVRLSSAPQDAPFWLLGDVMPQLRLEVRPPPGFCPAKQNVILDMSNRDNSTGSTMLNSHFGKIGFESLKSSHRSGILVSTIADNRFVESFSEGMQHDRGMHSPRYSKSLVGESGSDVNYLLAQKRMLEQRQNAPHNSLPHATGKDSSPMASTIPNSPSPAVSSGESPFSNLSDTQAPINNCHAGLELPQNTMDSHQNQHFGPQFGLVVQQQQQLLQPHNLPYLLHLANQTASIVSPEQLRSSDIAQDTQMLNMLARQYSQSQAPLQSQVYAPSQLSLFNECLVLKQQLQQQQQQLQLQQQHLLLSQLLAGHQFSPHFGDSPQQLDSSVPVGDVPMDNFLISQSQEAQTNNNILADNLHDGRDSTIQTVNFLDSNNTNNPSCSGPVLLQMPHQIFDIALTSKKLESSQDVGDHHATNVCFASGQGVTSPISDALEKPVEAFGSSDAPYLNCHAKEPKLSMPQPSEGISSECSLLSLEASSTCGFGSPIVNQICAIKISSDDNFIEQHHTNFSVAKDPKYLETCKTKKSSERKARKKKNSKTQLALDLLKEFSNSNQLEQPKLKFDAEDLSSHELSEAQTGKSKQPNYFVSTAVEDSSNSSFKPADYLKSLLPASVTDKEVETSYKKAESIDGGISEFSSLRAWKSAPEVKVKSLKEIQAEEQQRVQMENMASEIEPISTSCELSVPWAGIVVGLDHNPGGGIQVDRNGEDIFRSDTNLSSKSRLGHLHDLLAEEVLAKSSVGDDRIFMENKVEFSSAAFGVNISGDIKGQLLSPALSVTTSVDASAVHDEGFIETKDSKKGQKKGPKAKVVSAKSSSPVSSFDTSSSIAVERKKNQNQTQKGKEGLSAPSTASLADFISRKGEQANSSQAAAWSMDTSKLQKPTSLRDIQKEQENKLYAQQNIAITTQTKMQYNMGNSDSGLLQVVGSYPSSGSSPIQGSSTLASRHLKPKLEADLFWDLVDHPKQQEEQSDFPSLGNSNSSSSKAHAKTNPITISRQKSSNNRPSLRSPSASLLSASKGDKNDDEAINISEATDFRDWCHEELARLTGANDTSFLEYCSKQSTTEAEMLLKANLGPFDPNHEFIDKFLSYKDFLSPKVIEIAFRANDDRLNQVPHQVAGSGSTADVETGKAGRKKGKKGKKISAAVLGFNVSSNNRIMKGEIQTADD